MQIFTSIVVGIATWAVLAYVGLEQAALWGLLAGVFNSIPYYGPLIVSGGLSLVAFLQFGTFCMMLVVARYLPVDHIARRLAADADCSWGESRQMNRVAVFVGLLFWSWAWGIWGLLLAVPMMMSIKVICDHVEDLKPVGQFSRASSGESCKISGMKYLLARPALAVHRSVSHAANSSTACRAEARYEQAGGAAPRFTAAGELIRPADFRDWVLRDVWPRDDLQRADRRRRAH